MNTYPLPRLEIGTAIWFGGGETHWAVGDRMVSTDRNTFILWTACGRYDVPSNRATYVIHEDIVDCNLCIEMKENGFEWA